MAEYTSAELERVHLEPEREDSPAEEYTDSEVESVLEPGTDNRVQHCLEDGGDDAEEAADDDESEEGEPTYNVDLIKWAVWMTKDSYRGWHYGVMWTDYLKAKADSTETIKQFDPPDSPEDVDEVRDFWKAFDRKLYPETALLGNRREPGPPPTARKGHYYICPDHLIKKKFLSKYPVSRKRRFRHFQQRQEYEKLHHFGWRDKSLPRKLSDHYIWQKREPKLLKEGRISYRPTKSVAEKKKEKSKDQAEGAISRLEVEDGGNAEGGSSQGPGAARRASAASDHLESMFDSDDEKQPAPVGRKTSDLGSLFGSDDEDQTLAQTVRFSSAKDNGRAHAVAGPSTGTKRKKSPERTMVKEDNQQSGPSATKKVKKKDGKDGASPKKKRKEPPVTVPEPLFIPRSDRLAGMGRIPRRADAADSPPEETGTGSAFVFPTDHPPEASALTPSLPTPAPTLSTPLSSAPQAVNMSLPPHPPADETTEAVEISVPSPPPTFSVTQPTPPPTAAQVPVPSAVPNPSTASASKRPLAPATRPKYQQPKSIQIIDDLPPSASSSRRPPMGRSPNSAGPIRSPLTAPDLPTPTSAPRLGSGTGAGSTAPSVRPSAAYRPRAVPPAAPPPTTAPPTGPRNWVPPSRPPPTGPSRAATSPYVPRLPAVQSSNGLRVDSPVMNMVSPPWQGGPPAAPPLPPPPTSVYNAANDPRRRGIIRPPSGSEPSMASPLTLPNSPRSESSSRIAGSRTGIDQYEPPLNATIVLPLRGVLEYASIEVRFLPGSMTRSMTSPTLCQKFMTYRPPPEPATAEVTFEEIEPIAVEGNVKLGAKVVEWARVAHVEPAGGGGKEAWELLKRVTKERKAFVTYAESESTRVQAHYAIVIASPSVIEVGDIGRGEWNMGNVSVALYVLELPFTSVDPPAMPNPIRPFQLLQEPDEEPMSESRWAQSMGSVDLVESYSISADNFKSWSGKSIIRYPGSDAHRVDNLASALNEEFKRYDVQALKGGSVPDTFMAMNWRLDKTVRSSYLRMSLPRKTSIYAVGPSLSLYPQQYGLRRIWEKGALVTFSPTFILRSPEKFTEVMKMIRVAKTWDAYVIPSIIQWFQSSVGEMTRCPDPTAAFEAFTKTLFTDEHLLDLSGESAASGGGLSVSCAPPSIHHQDACVKWMEWLRKVAGQKDIQDLANLCEGISSNTFIIPEQKFPTDQDLVDVEQAQLEDLTAMRMRPHLLPYRRYIYIGEVSLDKKTQQCLGAAVEMISADQFTATFSGAL